MIIPTEEQVIERWDELPVSLKEALTSDANSDLIWKVSEAEHVPDQKIYEIARAVSQVLYGFIHPEDMAPDLIENSQLHPKTVAAIVDKIDQKIFVPLRQDLNQVYKPLEKIAQNSKSSQSSIPSAAPAGPKIISESFDASSMSIGSTPLASNKNVAAPAPQAQKAGGGWSAKQAFPAPVVQLGAISPAVPTPSKPATVGASTATQPSGNITTPSKTMSEFDRLDLMKKGVTAQTTEPGPVILHDANLAPTQKSSDFHLNTKATDQFVSNKAGAMPIKSAVLELGNVPKPSSSDSASKVVHYSEYKTTTPPTVSEKNSGPRQITEITPAPAPAPTPAPISQPTVPSMPQPPKPQAKVIVQDFLGPSK